VIQSIARWPAWYLVLIGYTALVALSALRAQARITASIRGALATVTDPGERARLTGMLVGGWARAIVWLVAVVLLLAGTVWALTIVAVVYAFSAKKAYSDYAQGFAEGRKAAALAAAPEYVRGRVPPRTPDFVSAGVFTGVTRLLPLAATLIAMRWLPR